MYFTSHVTHLLEDRERSNNPIKVAIIGPGWFGSGLVCELYRLSGMMPKVLFGRNIDKCVSAFIDAGIPREDIAVVESFNDFRYEMIGDKYVVCTNMEFTEELSNVDVCFEATGDILLGAKIAINVLKRGIHFITVGAELDCTIGHVLNKIAKENGVIYSNSDGDQPGVANRMIEYVKFMGFKITAAGNCKGFLNVHNTPEDVVPWVRPGHNLHIIAACADGSKQSTELAILANATGLVPDKRGMHGVTTTKNTLVDDLLKVISQEGIVDYTLGISGINQGAGVFVIGKKEGKGISDQMDYLKKGKGPHYLFFKDEHLCHYEATMSIAEVVLLNVPTIAPQGKIADVLTVAKKDLKVGEKLDGIGGYTNYGLIDKYEVIRKENLLPLGLAEYAVMTCAVNKDTPITYAMVKFPKDNLVLKLRKEQDSMDEKLYKVDALSV